jgi:hypothetical protein
MNLNEMGSDIVRCTEPDENLLFQGLNSQILELVLVTFKKQLHK